MQGVCGSERDTVVTYVLLVSAGEVVSDLATLAPVGGVGGARDARRQETEYRQTRSDNFLSGRERDM